MKKIMITSGTFSAIVMSIGIFFKFMHWPGASACIILGIVISSLVFLTFAIYIKSQGKTKHQRQTDTWSSKPFQEY